MCFRSRMKWAGLSVRNMWRCLLRKDLGRKGSQGHVNETVTGRGGALGGEGDLEEMGHTPARTG